ncbi:acyl-CoA dehydrogenase family protein [Alicyclobacillus sendaiensis]|uniref:Acyl-CoA dehydrogenase family protein n=1 Tax=Alicyclobacillus sendaiensis PA2 TaxID=3029425 RepID=A0ABT6XUP0_ALISE|nr:acyl-CoA dehydrogenase family protein [Alicyclobacillus sendaiensis]MDI9258792.1 acyl-CoA dehydrogenase family protein [Alicyclobacillus sendaiensis PA2]
MQQVQIPGGEFLLRSADPADVYTPEEFTEEHRMIRKTARDFVEREVWPAQDAIEAEDFDRVVQLLKRAGDLGLLAHSVPEAYGGLGLDKISKGIVGEMVGMTGAYGVAHSNHTCIATLPITYFASESVKRRVLPKMASGEYLGAYCLTEPTAGSDALAAKTVARLSEDGKHYLISGTKQFITNAGFADTFVVYAKIDGEHFTAFLVERSFPGISLGPEEQKMGIHGSSTRQVIFDECPVPVENVIGEIGRGHAVALGVLNLGRFNLGAGNVGGAKRALAVAARYAAERRQFGRAIAEFPATQAKLASVAARIYAAESLVYRTAAMLEDALAPLYGDVPTREKEARLREHAIECAVCKVYGSETLWKAADEAVQIHGGYGYIREYHVERMLRDARIQRIFEGTNEINRLLIPTHFLRRASRQPELISRLSAVVDALGKPAEVSGGSMARERTAVAEMRALFLAGSALVADRFAGRLDAEQEVAMHLADLAIALYAAESALVRAEKAATGAQAEVHAALASVAVDDEVQAAVHAAIALFAAIGDHAGVRERALDAIRHLASLRDPDGIATRRKLARAVVEQGGYPVD